MNDTENKIDIFTKSIIRRQFGIISAITEPYNEDFNFEQSAILLTAIQDRFDYIIHKGVTDGVSSNHAPICFVIFNNTADRVSNKHWERTVLNFARKYNQYGFIVGYDNVLLTEPLSLSGGQGLVCGTIKLLKIASPPSRSATSRVSYINQSNIVTASYSELLSCYGALIGGDSKIKFSVDKPFVKVECVHKAQPYLTEKNISDYYKKHKYFDGFYTSGYYDYKSSPMALARAKEQLKWLLLEPLE